MITGWEGFFEAEVGASAALAGLIFVGVSININRIISIPRLPARAIQALAVLLAILVISLIFLVPDQSIIELGFEILFVGLVVWITNLQFDVRNYKMTEQKYRKSYISIVFLNQSATFLYVVSGILTIISGSIGVYFLVPATILSFLKAIIDAWVLLVEINR